MSDAFDFEDTAAMMPMPEQVGQEQQSKAGMVIKEVDVDSLVLSKTDISGFVGEDDDDGDGSDDDEEERLIVLPPGFFMSDLDKNIYTLIFTGAVSGPGFWFGLIICAFQSMIVWLVLVDGLDRESEDNPLKVPPGNDLAVTIAQALLMFILPQISDDMMEGLEVLIDGYHSEVLKVCPSATMWKWFLSGFLHFAIGVVMIFDVFVLLIQQTTVIDLGLKYAAFGFFAKIDNIAFQIAGKGICSVALQKEIRNAGSVKVRKNGTYTWSRRFRDLLLTAGLIAGWAVLTYNQLNGKYLCEHIFVQMGDIFNPAIVELSGMFDILGIEHKHDRRAIYQERSSGEFRLAYCEEMKRWTLSSYVNETFQPCGSDDALLLAMSGPDEGYSVLDSSDSWMVTAVRHTDSGSTPGFTHFSMFCNECSSKCQSGVCNENNQCVCEKGHYGVNCEFAEPCDLLTVDRNYVNFPVRLYGLSVLPEEFALLTLDDGSNVSSSREGVLQVEYRPVYYGGDEDHGFLLFFAGRRWVISDYIDGIWLDSLDGPWKPRVVDLLSDPSFSLIDANYDPYFASAPMDIETPENSVTPTGLPWYHAIVDNHGLWWVETSEAVGTVLHCGHCDFHTNPCQNNGWCNSSQVCECDPGHVGSLCEYEVKCTDPLEHDATQIQGCLHEMHGTTCTASGRCENCPIGQIGNRCDYSIDCMLMGAFLAQLGYGSEELLEEGFCLNDGTCTNETGQCDCPEPFFGTLCQFPNASDVPPEIMDLWESGIL